MTTQDQLLGQDDIDALLAGTDEDESSGPSEVEGSESADGEDTTGLLGQDALHELKQRPELISMPLLRPGNRLSITPLTPAQWHFILQLE